MLPSGKINFIKNLTFTQTSCGFSPTEFVMKERVNDDCKYCANLMTTSTKDPSSYDDLGVEPPRRSEKCRSGKDCSYRGLMQTEREAEEYRLIEEGVKYCQDTGKFSVSYPFLDDPYKLGDNYSQAKKIAEREEVKLEKEGLTKKANEVFAKIEEQGAIR